LYVNLVSYCRLARGSGYSRRTPRFSRRNTLFRRVPRILSSAHLAVLVSSRVNLLAISRILLREPARDFSSPLVVDPASGFWSSSRRKPARWFLASSLVATASRVLSSSLRSDPLAVLASSRWGPPCGFSPPLVGPRRVSRLLWSTPLAVSRLRLVTNRGSQSPLGRTTQRFPGLPRLELSKSIHSTSENPLTPGSFSDKKPTPKSLAQTQQGKSLVAGRLGRLSPGFLQ